MNETVSIGDLLNTTGNTAGSIFFYDRHDNNETLAGGGDMLNMMLDTSQLSQTSAVKRRRTTFGGDFSGGGANDVSTFSSGTGTGFQDEYGADTPRSRRSTSQTLRMAAEVDELKLKNEIANEKLSEVTQELTYTKDKLMRQIDWMETQNNNLKKESESRLQKYYDEKKKWQTVLRESKDNWKKERNELVAASKEDKSSKSSKEHNDNISTSAFRALEEKLKALDSAVRDKSTEVKILQTEKIKTTNKLFKVEEELRLAQLQVSSSGDFALEQERASTLTTKCASLEDTLKRVTRAHDKLEARIKNQSILEVQLEACNKKLLNTQQTVDSQMYMMTENKKLKEDKEEWSVKFHHCVKDANPLRVYETFTTLQSENTQLLLKKSKLEAEIKEHFRTQEQLKKQVKEADKGKQDVEAEMKATAFKINRLQRQLGLYEGEVANLRAMLATYDAEFKIGRPAESKVIAMKDEMIAQLRNDMDKTRILFIEHTKKEVKHEDDTSSTNTATSDSTSTSTSASEVAELKGELDHLKRRYKELANEYLAHQHFTGMDFLPDKTRVLHLSANPSFGAGKGVGVPIASSLPKDQLEILRQENKQLKEELQHRQGAEDEEPSSSSSGNQSMNMSIAVGSQGGKVAAQGQPGATSNEESQSKLNTRLKEMFKERITAFREAVYLLTGYKIDLYNQSSGPGQGGRLRLRSMYAEMPEDALLFQWTGDSLELLETDYATKLDPKLFAFLRTCNSVPAFLSNLTVELFENQTFMG